MLSLMALTVFQGLGTFLVAFERRFGWTRTQMSGAFALARAEGRGPGTDRGLADRQAGKPAHDPHRLRNHGHRVSIVLPSE